jgi:hypothetical protein
VPDFGEPPPVLPPAVCAKVKEVAVTKNTATKEARSFDVFISISIKEVKLQLKIAPNKEQFNGKRNQWITECVFPRLIRLNLFLSATSFLLTAATGSTSTAACATGAAAT